MKYSSLLVQKSLLIVILVFWGPTMGLAVDGPNLRYARGFHFEKKGAITLVEVGRPRPGAKNGFKYLLKPGGLASPSGYGDYQVSIVALAADLIAQLPGQATILPLNAVTALIGSPIIIWFILSRRKVQRSFI